MLPKLLGDLVGGVGSIIDDLHTSDEERLTARRRLVALHTTAVENALEYEAHRLRQGAETVRAEVASQSVLARNWRPAVVLFFAGVVGAHWFGWTSEGLGEAEVLKLMDIVEFSLGGYVVGRTVEKMAPAVISTLIRRGPGQ